MALGSMVSSPRRPAHRSRSADLMIFIVVKLETKPEWTARWPDLVSRCHPTIASPHDTPRVVHRRHPRRGRQPVVRVVAQTRQSGPVRAGRSLPRRRCRRRARQERPLQAGDERPSTSVEVDTEDHQSDRRRDRLVENGRVDSGVTVRLDSTLWIYFCRHLRREGL